MVEGISKANQNKITEFVKDEIVYFAVGNQYYNKIFKFNDRDFLVEQAFADIMQADIDCENLYKYLGMYDSVFRRFPRGYDEVEADDESFLDEKGKAYNCYILVNKDMKYIIKALRVVRDYIKQQEKEGKKILLVSLMAGHGMIANNDQVLLCNKMTKHRFYE